MSIDPELWRWGPKLWQVCDKCNYELHRCMFCGDDLTHAEDYNGTHIRECRPDLIEELLTWKEEDVHPHTGRTSDGAEATAADSSGSP